MSKQAKKKAEAEDEETLGAPEEGAGRVRGTAEMGELRSVVPNHWNPNKMTADMFASLRHGLRTDGWIASMALLVWGSDETGTVKNIIIDGEHRWKAALAEGYTRGPMVFLHGVSQAQAMAQTIKLDRKRGSFEEGLLAGVLKELQVSLDSDDLGLDLGFDDATLMKYLAEPELPIDAGEGEERTAESSAERPAETAPQTEANHVRLVQLFFDAAQREEWNVGIQAVAKRHGTSNMTDAAIAALRDALASYEKAAAE